MATSTAGNQDKPLESLEHWDEFLQTRYPEVTDPKEKSKTVEVAFKATDPNKKKEQFRNYEADARPGVKDFYRLNHQHQTLNFVLQKKKEYLGLSRKKMGIWEAMEFLNNLIDDSDPDTNLSQIEHLLQTAEHMRADGKPRWFILTGLIHDLGKILCLFGEPQWAVVGDTFPVGCGYSEKIIFHSYFKDNPDIQDPKLQSKLGIYTEGCGLNNVHLSWGHDEYLYHVVKDYLPTEALYMIRYHSFYPWHREGAYDYLCEQIDREMLPWVNEFNPYDLYTKSHEKPNVEKLKPFYQELIAEYFPDTLNW